ncbi:replication protein [Acinetobacter calcoaceticus]|uniref:replication protein n=1 Tax=Acinetobacter calcoaceticus TaxID=471 RepID=UPI0018DBB4A2|nr:replication protein [Acinetobacter calcoaceticus]
MKTNLAHKHEPPQAEVLKFPKKELQAMSKKEEGYTRMPNSLIDDQIMAQLNDKAFKCLMLIVRQTSGFDRTLHTIAITQFQKYCGIKKRDTVMSCIKELEDKKIIFVSRKTGCLNEYSINTNPSLETVLPPNGTSTIEGDGTSTAKRDGTSPVKRGTNKETLKETFKENIYVIFEFWKTTFSKNEKTLLSDKRARKIQSRLVEGYQVEDIKHAILNCSKSDYHLQNGYTDIELICREPEKLDRFINMFPKADQNMAPASGSYEADMGDW